MHNELTNLLPQERQRALLRDYLFRLGVVSALFASALLFSATVLLVPTYFLLSQSAKTKEAHLANVESTLTSINGEELSARLTALARSATNISSLVGTPSASATMRAALALPRPGVTLSSLVYAPAAGKGAATLTISGLAVTRDALRRYQLALSDAPFARSADLPVSAYAKDANLTFTITVTLAP